MKTLKAEAKSVNKLQEVSYQLENKVVDLTQSLTAKIQDNKALMEEISNLKDLLKQQGQAHETLKSREIEFNSKLMPPVLNINKKLKA